MIGLSSPVRYITALLLLPVASSHISQSVN